MAAEIAADRGWPRDWLNDGVRVYLSPNVETPGDHRLLGTYPSEKTPGLRVFVPTAEYMLAMKLMALRIDEENGKDLADLRNLIAIVGIETRGDLIDLAARYYPEARVSAKLILAADALLAASKEPSDETPRYLGRVLAAAAEDARYWSPAWAGFLDAFYMEPTRRQAMIDPEPPMTGNARRDAYMAAAAEHLARRWDLAIPAWTSNPARTLHEPYFIGGIEALKPLLLAQSPLAFRKRMIFVEHEPLSRAPHAARLSPCGSKSATAGLAPATPGTTDARMSRTWPTSASIER